MRLQENLELDLRERVKKFQSITYPRVIRNGSSYSQTEIFTRRALSLCVWTYRRLNETNQTARLLRDVIDFLLRRYHGYCIKEKFGAHYREVGVKPDEKIDFEHVIPAAIARDLLLHGFMSITEAMNIPTCMVRRANHKKLNSNKLAKTTPDLNKFWERYSILNIQVETHRGDAVDMATWDLAKHYQYFNIQP